MHYSFVRFPLSAVLGAYLALSLAFAAAQGNDVTISVNSVGGSGVTATASLTASGNQTVITVSARGLTAGTSNMNQINFGTCAATGNDAFILSNLVAGADGTATTTDTINATLASLQDGNHLVHIHRGAGAAEGDIVACGNIPQAAVVAASPTAAATAQATAAARATAAASVTPAVAGATATAATPAALPASGGLPILPAGAIGAAALAAGYYLRRRR